MDWDFFLIQKIKNGNDDAVEGFVRKYYSMILKYCRFHVLDKQNAEDLTQETFERFFASLCRYEHKGKLENYLYVIAGNLCKDSYRHKQEIYFEELPDSAENTMAAVEMKITLEQAIWKLPEELREVIILYYFHDKKLKEIAEILEIGLPLVKYRIRKAKDLLREDLREEEDR